ncbi:putative disease resistance RPP13-like protein 3 [Apium graveolens]|uniref:putative disease resistance RPP13-like protein 3 n=1 Tax=Apium graveolens TaxID=4045 RepID=UPI003D793928
MVDAVVSFTIEKLSEFVTKQVNIRIGVKDGIEWLRDELGYLLTSVRAAEAHQGSDHIRLWTDSVRNVANQALVILERFSAQQQEHEHEAHEQGGVLDRMRSFICICKKEANLYDIGKDIDSLKENIAVIKSRRDEYRINDIIINNFDMQQRKRTFLRAASFDHEDDVIGFEDDVQTLLAQLGNGDPFLRLISIYGMGGLGKSTLASKLYHSSELSYFDSRAWVCVSEEYEITNVLRMIIRSFTGGKQDSLNEMEEVELRRHLRKILLDVDIYLLVIDDIWDVEVWKKIKNVFPDKKNGSRVIITTRNKKVAEGVDDKCFVHELRFLRADESWRLFCKRTKPTPNLEILGKEMVSKCGGLPLAIVILAGLLLQNKTYTFWSEVKHNLWRRLKGKSSEIKELLNLSYDDLSFRTRQCFLYLARFPEDHKIDVFKLKLLWIAEEFISEADEEDGVHMEDVAEDYVNEFINRNMIQIELLSPGGQVLICRIHDLVRDLAIEKATEHKILRIFDSSKQHPNPIRSLQGQSRHAIYNGIDEYLKLLGPNPDALMLRSLAKTKKTVRGEVEEVKLMYTRFKYLKVLDLTLVRSSEGIPEEIGDLILLKFLGLMSGIPGQVLVIPPSIGKLKKLQTLRGSRYYYIPYKYPKEMCELKEIRHLMFYANDGKMNIGGDQTKLRTINCISYAELHHIDTTNWTNLHTLKITGSRRGKEGECYSLECIANLTNLRSLSVYMNHDVISTVQPLGSCKHLKRVVLYGLMKDPEQLSLLPDSVIDLVLVLTNFKKDPLLILKSLSNLTALRLQDSYSGKKMVCSADAFPCLQSLSINTLWNLKELQVDIGALPSLRAFETFCCPSLKMYKIPLRITSLPQVPYIPAKLLY